MRAGREVSRFSSKIETLIPLLHASIHVEGGAEKNPFSVDRENRWSTCHLTPGRRSLVNRYLRPGTDCRGYAPWHIRTVEKQTHQNVYQQIIKTNMTSICKRYCNLFEQYIFLEPNKIFNWEVLWLESNVDRRRRWVTPIHPAARRRNVDFPVELVMNFSTKRKCFEWSSWLRYQRPCGNNNSNIPDIMNLPATPYRKVTVSGSKYISNSFPIKQQSTTQTSFVSTNNSK